MFLFRAFNLIQRFDAVEKRRKKLPVVSKKCSEVQCCCAAVEQQLVLPDSPVCAWASMCVRVHVRVYQTFQDYLTHLINFLPQITFSAQYE